MQDNLKELIKTQYGDDLMDGHEKGDTKVFVSVIRGKIIRSKISPDIAVGW